MELQELQETNELINIKETKGVTIMNPIEYFSKRDEAG